MMTTVFEEKSDESEGTNTSHLPRRFFLMSQISCYH